MTQFQFDLICRIIDGGAPVLANELCGALNGLVRDFNAATAENEQLKTQVAELTKPTEEAKNTKKED